MKECMLDKQQLEKDLGECKSKKDNRLQDCNLNLKNFGQANKRLLDQNTELQQQKQRIVHLHSITILFGYKQYPKIRK